MKMIKSFMRFGSKKSGSVENFNRGGVPLLKVPNAKAFFDSVGQ